VSSFLTAHQQN